jgi:2-phospho-L-lactate guanylyltransferase
MIAAVIPVKRLESAKSRLAAVLSDGERQALVLDMLDRTIDAVRGCAAVERIALCTPERALAERSGAEWVPDAGDLNASLRAAARWATSAGTSALLILPADLPLVTSADIAALLAAGNGRDGVAIAACTDGGTGALLLKPPDAIEPSFGPDSYARHIGLARMRHIPVRTVSAEGLTRDLDTEADLAALWPSACRK